MSLDVAIGLAQKGGSGSELPDSAAYAPPWERLRQATAPSSEISLASGKGIVAAAVAVDLAPPARGETSAMGRATGRAMNDGRRRLVHGAAGGGRRGDERRMREAQAAA